jgi:hypothetical protein
MLWTVVDQLMVRRVHLNPIHPSACRTMGQHEKHENVVGLFPTVLGFPQAILKHSCRLQHSVDMFVKMLEVHAKAYFRDNQEKDLHGHLEWSWTCVPLFCSLPGHLGAPLPPQAHRDEGSGARDDCPEGI